MITKTFSQCKQSVLYARFLFVIMEGAGDAAGRDVLEQAAAAGQSA
jgi:hypothetical protein